MKVHPGAKRRCKDCRIVRRKSGINKLGRRKWIVRVVCNNPRHKQRQG